MSIVVPRPLSVLHYERDRAQGNVTRFLVKGGLLGLGHINKGTAEMKLKWKYQQTLCGSGFSRDSDRKIQQPIAAKAAPTGRG